MLKRTHSLIVIIALVFLSGCSPLNLLNATVSSDGYQASENHTYGIHPRQKLDIHIPTKIKKNADVLIFYYGGRWQYGNKELYRFVADAFTSKGIVTVIPDYRVYPEADWPDFIQDGADAYAWTYANIEKYGGKPGRIFVMGHSAGAHISAMVALNEDLLDPVVKRPCGFIGLAGPYDFLPIDQDDIKQVFGTASNLDLTQPINFVGVDEPAMLLLHGSSDTTVKPGNSKRLARKMSQFSGKAILKLYKDVDHSDILVSLSSTFRSSNPSLDDSVKFIEETSCH